MRAWRVPGRKGSGSGAPAKEAALRRLLAAGTGIVKTAKLAGVGVSAVQRITARYGLRCWRLESREEAQRSMLRLDRRGLVEGERGWYRGGTISTIGARGRS
jgi:hypothetical protein